MADDDDFCFVHHDQLGYAPRPGFRGTGAEGWQVTIDQAGLRACGSTGSGGRAQPILAVGDSYTFGEEVADAETWPAQLQRLTGRAVLNGGVSGYGFDQVVLRAEDLVRTHDPVLTIVGFIADDIRRTEMRRVWWRNKPWFALDGDQLVLKGAPVPRNRTSAVFRRHAERFLMTLPPALQGLFRYRLRAHPAGTGPAIAKHLIARLARLQASYRSPVVLMAQYDPHVWISAEHAAQERAMTLDVLGCAEAHGLGTIDTFPRFAAEPSPARFYGNSHMNARGNAIVASLVAARLPGIVPPSAA